MYLAYVAACYSLNGRTQFAPTSSQIIRSILLGVVLTISSKLQVCYVQHPTAFAELELETLIPTLQQKGNPVIVF